MQAILHNKIQIAKAVNVTVIRLDDAPQGYVDFDKGTAKKFVIDPQHFACHLAWRYDHRGRPSRTVG
jgi:glutathione-independent formaldehyde dehydrogenase